MHLLQILSSAALLRAPFFSSSSPPAGSASEHCTDFNSTFALTAEQLASTNLTTSQTKSLQVAIRFDRTELANGGSLDDDFYTLPPLDNQTVLKPGVLLKTQEFTNPAPFAIPPNTALSRFLYTTTNINGTVIPASAYVLWPYLPRTFQNKTTGDKAPVVLVTHPTSGLFAATAPSMHRFLWFGEYVPFPLALDGYAVVAPDYAGLGIGKSWDGSEIPHQYLISPAGAADALYALRAARVAFQGRLQDEYVVMGHSQGGGVAWGVAELLHSAADKFNDLVKGYRGTVAAGPVTDAYSGSSALLAPLTAFGVKSVFPTFQLSDWLTPVAVARQNLFKKIQGSVSALYQLFLYQDGLVKDGVPESWYAVQYGKLGNSGRKPFRGPLLVIQGTDDPVVNVTVTEKTVADTCGMYPDSDLHLRLYANVGHSPDLDASRQYWLQWIRDRFEETPLEKQGCVKEEVTSWLDYSRYLKAGNSFPLWAGLPQFSSYELAIVNA